MSSADIKSMPAAKARAARKRGNKSSGLADMTRDDSSGHWTARRPKAIPGILRAGSLHPAIEAAADEGSLMLMRGNTQRLRRAGIEKEEAT